jgi:GNAT superfamily N-acetyltransferase
MHNIEDKGFFIREPEPSDREEWEVLWNAYLVFYESTIPREHTDILWERIMDDDHPIRAYVAVRADDGKLIGIVQFFPHLDTWEIEPICYLQDLYVAEDARLKGIGAALIREVKEYSDQQGWVFVYWRTAEDNKRARHLYDKLAGEPIDIAYQFGERTAGCLGDDNAS